MAQRAEIERSRPERAVAPGQQKAGPSEPPAPEEPPGWYGLGGLVADAGAAALVVGGYKADSFTPILAGYGLYLAGGPLNHLIHGEGLRALRSLGLRAAPVLLAAALAAPALDEVEGAEGNDGACGAACVGFFTFSVGGTLTMALIDDLALSSPEKPEWQARSWTFGVSPVAHGGWMAGAAGVF